MKADPRDVRLEPERRRTIARDAWGFLWAKRAYWLLPLILVLFLVLVAVFLGETPAGHLVYALF